MWLVGGAAQCASITRSPQAAESLPWFQSTLFRSFGLNTRFEILNLCRERSRWLQGHGVSFLWM
uniref:Uncharacterized protein n=1 Tax=Anguilla anguilla TaxID=7936 RepID=A0A0E9PKN4_ANGAN